MSGDRHPRPTYLPGNLLQSGTCCFMLFPSRQVQILKKKIARVENQGRCLLVEIFCSDFGVDLLVSSLLSGIY